MGGQTDIQFKDDLRKDLRLFQRLLRLAENDTKDELIEELQAQIDRITASLQD